MALIFNEINKIIGGRLAGDSKQEISHFIIDSRKQIPSESALFFAITGERNDGHKYITELAKKGVRHFVVEKIPPLVPDYSLSFIQVEDTRIALQKLAAYFRSQYMGEVISIAGSNGKTILKEWIFQSLSDSESVQRSPQSYNSQVGVPLSIFLMDPKAHYWILEAGISFPGEMQNLEKMIKPRIGIFTNIGEAHQENFSSVKEKVVEKLKLFEHSEILLYCSNNKLIAEEVLQLPAKQKRISWGKSIDSDYIITESIEKNLLLKVEGKAKGSFKIKFSDTASKENLSHLIVFLFETGFDQNEIQNALDKLEPVAMRMEIVKASGNSTIINDAYNSDLISLENALDYLASQNQHPSKTLILSDILQSGKSFNVLLEKLEELIRARSINRIIFIGEEFYQNRKMIGNDIVVYPDTDSFLRNISSIDFNNEAILLKGSRKYEFERIAEVLQEKNHRTILEINLNSLVENYRFYRSLIKPEVKVMAMVKAFSYGSGGYEIANVLQYNKIDYLAVAFADEGVSLRKNGIHLPIMVMSPEKNDFFSISEYSLEPEIYGFRILEEFNAYIEKSGLTDYPVHIKVDTGMKRLGFAVKDAENISLFLNKSSLKAQSVFTHLSAADEEKHDEFTRIQVENFQKFCRTLSELSGQKFLKHVLNSAGIERFPEYAFDMVRLGIGLYGVSSSKQAQLGEVSTFKTRIAQIRTVEDNETIGYGRKGKVTKASRIATLPVGYADGLPRILSNGRGKLKINNKFASIVGNICMDMTMVDVTHIKCEEGDEVLIFGEGLSVSDVAKSAETIPYEILTSISQRVKRIYYHD